MLISQHSILNEEQVRETCRTLYLVGGFGASPFLEEAIRDVVSESRLNINILRPVDPCSMKYVICDVFPG